MSFEDMTLGEFNKVLSSKAPTPGGGGAAALAGALAVSLSGMVCALTLGKKKFAEFEDEVSAICNECETLRDQMLTLIEADATAFAPLAAAYSIPKDAPDRNAVMEEALKAAAAVPMQIAEKAFKAIKIAGSLLGKSSNLAVSDIGCAAALGKAALQSAALNVKINTALMDDRQFADYLDTRLVELIEKGNALADETYKNVWERL